MYINPSSFILRKPFVSIAINKKVKFDGARCPFSTFLRLQGDHHCACAQKWCHFSFFSRAFKQKKIKAPRPKMTKIASRGGGSCLKRKKYFTSPSCVPHWERKTSPRSTALVNRIGLQPFLRTRLYPALVLCSATAVEADFAVRPKVRQYTREVLKQTESLIVPKTSPTQALGCAGVAED